MPESFFEIWTFLILGVRPIMVYIFLSYEEIRINIIQRTDIEAEGVNVQAGKGLGDEVAAAEE